MNKKPSDIFIIKQDGDIPHYIDLDSITERIEFSNGFWQYFSSAFPDATVALFNQANNTDNSVQLSNPLYVGIVIHNFNRLPILNRMPKDLSKEQSENYFKGGGFFVFPVDSLDQEPKEEYSKETQWKKAPLSIQNEYKLFRNLVADSDNHFVVIAEKKFIQFIEKY